MAPEKGNKYGVGKGRQPKTFSDEQVEEMGKDLLKWMADNQNNDKIVHLSQWYYQHADLDYREWDALQVRACFLPYYKQAIQWMGVRVLTNKRLSESYGNRFVGIYFKDVKEHERGTIEHKVDYELKKKYEIAAKETEFPNEKLNEMRIENIRLMGKMQEQAKLIQELLSQVKSKDA